mmetsp:Transcript_63534/g.113048  ORF Transcript_63534/g.113048 Transcript_63534/m.113048 type:complete len:167 (+) Transcript_63534:75-575(+)
MRQHAALLSVPGHAGKDEAMNSPVKKMRRDLWTLPGYDAETTSQQANLGAAEALRNAQPLRRFPPTMASPRLTGAGRASLGLASTEASAATTSSTVNYSCSAALSGSSVSRLFAAPPVSPRSTYALFGDDAALGAEMAPAEKRYNATKSEMIEVARMQANMKLLFR